MATKIRRSSIGIYIVFLFVLLAILCGILEIKKAINRSNEVLFSDESKVNDFVYADIVSITPESATKKVSNRTSDTLEGFFCTCVASDGKEFSAYIDAFDFSKYIKKPRYSWEARSRIPDRVDFDPPLRIHGKVSTRKSIVSYSGSTLLFEIYSSDNPQK